MSWNETRWEGGIWTTGTLLQFKCTFTSGDFFCCLLYAIWPESCNIFFHHVKHNNMIVIKRATPLRLFHLLSWLMVKKKKESEWLIHCTVISFSGGRSGWLTLTALKCGQSYIHAVTPIHSSLQHTGWKSPPHDRASWLLANACAFSSFHINTGGKIWSNPGQ